MSKLSKIVFGLLFTTTVFAQVIMIQPKDGAVSRQNHIAVTIAGKANAQASLYVNDSLAATNNIRIDGILDFLNIEVPVGPVTLRSEAVGAGGRIFSAEKTIHVLGPVKQIIPLLGDVYLPADGFSTQELQFELRDEWGYLLPDVTVASVSISTGTIMNEDIDTESGGHQVAVENAVATVVVQSPTDATERGEMKVQARGYTQVFPVKYTIPEEPLIVVGAINGAASNLAKGQDPDALPHFGLLNDNNRTLGSSAMVGARAAFYAKGSIQPGLRLTASLDTDRGYLDQLFVDVDPDELYPLFGDASSISYDVQSRSKLFAKLEQNESFLLFGDYNTRLTGTEFTAYNRSFNGILGKYIRKNHEVQVFGTATDRSMKQEEIRGEGISGFYYLDQSSLTRFSEKINIVTKDRYHPETILESKELTRFFDYDINYVDGTLMFKQPVPALDGNGNPIFIIISYEYQGAAARSLIAGVRQSSVLGEREQIKVGSSLITEQRESGAYVLYGVDGSMPINNKVAVAGELAQSFTPGALIDTMAIGTAFKTEVTIKPRSDLDVKTYLRTVGGDFKNASHVGANTETGSFKYGFNVQWNSEKYGRITSDFYDQSKTSGTSLTTNSRVFNLRTIRPMSDIATLKLGYENAFREQFNSADSLLSRDNSNLLRAEYNILLLEKIQAVFEHEQNLNFNNRTKPTNSSIGLVYPIAKQLEVYWKYRFIQGRGVNGQSVLGFRSNVNENTQITGKYEIGGITGEQRNKASIGLNNKWHIREDLVVNVALENTATVDSFEIPTPDHQALALSFEFLPEMPWKAIGKYEVRDDPSTLQRVIALGGDMRIFAGFGAIAKLDHWEARYKSGNQGSQTRENYQAGIAYRPEHSDRFNALAKLSYVSDYNSQVNVPVRVDRYILSAHSYWQFTNRIGVGSRFATRYVYDMDKAFEEDVTTQTYFLQSRVEIAWDQWEKLENKLSTIVDMRYINMQPLSEGLFGLAAEVDYLVMTNVQFGVGYILKNYKDPDFAFLDYQYHNLYFTLHTKFSEDIFNWR